MGIRNRENFSQCSKIKPNSDLAPNEIPFGAKSVSNRKSVITIQIWFNLTRFRTDFSVCEKVESLL